MAALPHLAQLPDGFFLVVLGELFRQRAPEVFALALKRLELPLMEGDDLRLLRLLHESLPCSIQSQKNVGVDCRVNRLNVSNVLTIKAWLWTVRDYFSCSVPSQRSQLSHYRPPTYIVLVELSRTTKYHDFPSELLARLMGKKVRKPKLKLMGKTAWKTWEYPLFPSHSLPNVSGVWFSNL